MAFLTTPLGETHLLRRAYYPRWKLVQLPFASTRYHGARQVRADTIGQSREYSITPRVCRVTVPVPSAKVLARDCTAGLTLVGPSSRLLTSSHCMIKAHTLNGWLLRDDNATLSEPATADSCGKLLYYVCGALRS